jgi:hypothetical protein
LIIVTIIIINIVIKSRRMRRAGNVIYMSVFVRKRVKKRPLAKPRHIKLYYYIIKMYLEATE